MRFIRLWHLIAFQCLILIGMFLKAYYPLWIGQEVVLPVVPQDPRDMFRGNYVSLNYAFSTIRLDTFPNNLQKDKTYHFGDALYVQLKKQGQLHLPTGLYEKCPEGSLCLRVTPTYAYTHTTYSNIYLQAGIESYFTNREQAEKLEQFTSSTSGDSVRIYVAAKIAPNGTARISKLMIQQ
ncbi:MAG: GDYXXLXY domain-containing protein [Cytophagales bacterium]|nr:GDYXXLXY domain-containing protein [Bernardetiaceae bacterium]MDW8205652.1 GDYXXLXY domain-containing protein [Cytophagales bacterium]